ncbi:MAG: AAA family ATPase [Nanoarchaeota archaeon]|nr:AAA family ATPase [Nanoarchaeota archaeon]
MLLKRLYLENIRSYEKQEIDFPKGSTLLSGDIGSGKTTVLLAIEFALFGLQPGQKGASLLRNGEDIGKVILEFEIEDKEIVVERTLKRSSKSINQEYSSITIDNEKFEESVTEIKSRILKLLNYPPEFAKKTNLLYKFTVYTPQEEMKQIVLEPGDIRLNTLRYVFGIDKYKRIEENTLILTTRLREKIRINEGILYNLEDINTILKNLCKELQDLKEKQKILSQEYARSIEISIEKEKIIQEIQEKMNEKRSLENEKSKSLVLMSEKNQQIISLKNNIRTLFLQIQEVKKFSIDESEYDSIEKKIKIFEEKEEILHKTYLDTIGRLNSLESRKKDLENLKLKLSGLQKCPTCLQEVSDDYKKNILYKTADEISIAVKDEEDFSNLKKQIMSELESVKKEKESSKKRKNELELLKIKLENLIEKEKRIIDFEKQINSIEKDIDLLKKHSEAIDKSIEEYKKYDSIFERYNLELKSVKIEENKSAIKNAEVNKDIQFTEQRIKEKTEEIVKKEELKRKTDRLRELEYFISEKFLGIILFTEKQVMMTLKEEFSKLFSRWFSMLVSDSLSAKLDEDFSPIIEQQDYELDYSFLSGGERTAIALAYRLALNQVINSVLSNIKTGNLVILDEPTDGFSSQQLDKIRDVLYQLDVDQLILVSHEQKIEGYVDNIIRVFKENNITKVIY